MCTALVLSTHSIANHGPTVSNSTELDLHQQYPVCQPAKVIATLVLSKARRLCRLEPVPDTLHFIAVCAAQASHGDELLLVFPVSKLLDTLIFPVTSDAPSLDEQLPYVQLIKQQELADQPGLVEVQLMVVSPKPCWGTLKFTASGVDSWSIKPGEWQQAGSFLSRKHSGSGSVMVGPGGQGSGSVGSSHDTVSSLLIKFTNEHQQEPLQWPVVLRVRAQQDTQGRGPEGGSLGLGVVLHVGLLDETPQLAAVEQRMPAWSTLSYHATIYVSHWQY